MFRPPFRSLSLITHRTTGDRPAEATESQSPSTTPETPRGSAGHRVARPTGRSRARRPAIIAAEPGIACWQYCTAMCYHVQVENRIASLVVDATDAEQLAQFWAGALGWQVVNRGSYGASIGVDGSPFEIDFRFVPDGPKLTKNRLHLDIKPVNRDQAAELDRLLALGARQVDVGQGAQSWFVLADPEGNEFCLCRP
jgi:hypothetical protein